MNFRMKMPPALLAILVQGLALVIAALLCRLMELMSGTAPPLLVLILLQGVCAYGLSIAVNMARWWRYIQLFFPWSIWLALQWDIPAHYFFLGFAVFAALFWSVFLTQVPFYPSRPAVWSAVAQLLPNQTIRILEIGSGLGNFAIHMAQSRPESRVEGIEIAPLPWFISICQAWVRQSKVRFQLGNYERVHFSEYDLIFAYLSPAAMPELWEKAIKEMAPNSLLISHEFPVPGVKETQQIILKQENRNCFVYQMGSYQRS